ncbi:MAG: O-antigen ligase family protein [Candidatus Hydrogenedentes bacterium]|nr:O-antigen ligase family protein [Candidatus Hydrogenedentota bacterium]
MEHESANSRQSIVERGLFLAFLVLMVAAPLVLSRFAHVQETKWFILRTMAPTLCAIWIAYRIALGKPWLHKSVLTGLAIGMLFATVLSIFAATNTWLVLMDIANRVALLSVFLLVSGLVATRRHRDAVLWTASFTGFAVAAYGVAQHFGYDFFPWREHHQVPVGRGVSFFGHATYSASFLILAMPLTAGLMVTRRSRVVATILGCFLLVMLAHLSFTGARAATLGLMASAILTFGVVLAKRRVQRTPSGDRPEQGAPSKAIAAGFLLVVFIGSALAVQAWRVKQSDVFAIRQVSGALRLYAWETASRMFFEHPWAGIGAGNYEVVSPRYWNELEQQHFARETTFMHEVHNEYLEVAVEQGIAGIAVLIALIVYALLTSAALYIHARRREDGLIALALFAAMAAASLDAIFNFNLQLPGSALLFWVVLGLIASGLRHHHSDVSRTVARSG